MAANLSQTDIVKAVDQTGKSFAVHINSPHRTEIQPPSSSGIRGLLEESPQFRTQPSTITGEMPIIPTPTRLSRPLPVSSPPVQRTSIDGVVSRVMDDFILVDCDLPTGSVELRFPLPMVPEELALYGKPVAISVEVVNGYKIPVIRHRATTTLPLTEEYQALSQWVSTLDD